MRQNDIFLARNKKSTFQAADRDHVNFPPVDFKTVVLLLLNFVGIDVLSKH